MKFQAFSDPQHSWVKVPRKLVLSLGIIGKITPYSYQRTDQVYLECDVDLGTFVNAMKAADKTVEFKENHTNRSSRIRNYSRFQVA